MPPLYGSSRYSHATRFPLEEGGRNIDIEKAGFPILVGDYFMMGGGVVSRYKSEDEVLALTASRPTSSVKIMYDAHDIR